MVGGGPAAASAVRGYRDAGGTGPITMLSDDAVAPYNRPPLSKDFLRGETEADALQLEDAEFWSDVDLRLQTRATALDPDAGLVTVATGERLPYDACVLATGAVPATLPVPGADQDGVLLLRSVDQARRLRAAGERAQTAVVVGSGFIGSEAAASLAARGLDVTLVTLEQRPQQDRLGPEAAERIAGWLRDDGIRLRTGAQVSALAPHRVEIEDADAAEGDLVLVAAGITPRVDLARAAGLEVDQGRVVVDARMRSSADGVWAAGDVALAHNAAAGRRLVVEHWGEALAMGEVAGAAAAGGDRSWDQAPGFWTDIGGRMLKYVAWGDGYDSRHLVTHGGGGFTVWYGQDGVTVGCLTYEADDDYERGRKLVEAHAPLP